MPDDIMRRLRRVISIVLSFVILLGIGYIATIRETFSEVNLTTRQIRTKSRHAFVIDSEWRYTTTRSAGLPESSDKGEWIRFSHVTKGLLHTSRVCNLTAPIH